MKKMITAILLALALALVAGCATSTPSAQLPVQYATLKLLEADAVTGEEVLAHTARIADLVLSEAPLSLGFLGEEVRALVGYAELPASDRLVIDAILGDAAHTLSIDPGAYLSDDHRLALLDMIVWVEQAAAMDGGTR